MNERPDQPTTHAPEAAPPEGAHTPLPAPAHRGRAPALFLAGACILIAIAARCRPEFESQPTPEGDLGWRLGDPGYGNSSELDDVTSKRIDHQSLAKGDAMKGHHSLFLYVGGDDARVLDLPKILSLPADSKHGPHEQKDAFGKRIKACGVQIGSDLAGAGEASQRLHGWLDKNGDFLRSLDVPYKWIRVSSLLDSESVFAASPSLMQKLIDAGLTLEVLVVRKEQ